MLLEQNHSFPTGIAHFHPFLAAFKMLLLIMSLTYNNICYMNVQNYVISYLVEILSGMPLRNAANPCGFAQEFLRDQS